MRLMLITGFLGAGKTTFLKRLLPLYAHEKLALIVNEFGQVGVDGTVLQGMGATLKEINGGSVFCSCRMDQFEAALAKVAEENPDLILVEASGLSDPTAVQTVVERQAGITYAGCVALCDAPRVEKTLKTLRICAKQLAVADLILINKADLVSDAESLRLTNLLQDRFSQARVEVTTDACFQAQWLDELQAHTQAVPFEETRDITLQKALVCIAPTMTAIQLRQFLRLFAEDTYRIKGFVALADGRYQVDCIGSALSVNPAALAQETEGLVVLAGQGMALRKSLLNAKKWYPDEIQELVFG